jgi:UDP-N-acetylglucosamine--N-acetylmuramyl-(pentapeptide) pyrophosphoryl-undecaprenol N-acetylglucosamine transferase
MEGNDPMKMAISGGGTGGHIYPAVAVVEHLRETGHNLDVVFIGTGRGLETGIVPRLGYRIHKIVSRPLPSRRNFDWAVSMLYASVGLVQSLLILLLERPSVVVGTGGYASGPFVMAATILGVPSLLIEPNSVPGRTVLMLSSHVDEVALGFPESIRHFARGTNLRVTGVPVRPDLFSGEASDGRKMFRLEEGRRTVFVFGGSRGATSINRAFVDALRVLGNRDDLQFIVQTGARDYGYVVEATRDVGLPCRVFEYIDHIGYAYAAADLVVARAGAVTIAELTSGGVPAILVPYPHATGRHQEANARLVEAAGGASVILDKDLNGQVLARAIVSVISDPRRIEDMSRRSGGLGRPDATKEIAGRLIELAFKKGRLSKLATALVELCSVR